MNNLQLNDFPLTAYDKLRYADTDRQGHVNNAAFSTFLETGRVEFLYSEAVSTLIEDATFVIAALDLKFLNEITWPGKVDIGTGILRIGNSSIQIYQQLFQNDNCAATATTTIVQVKDGKSLPLSTTAKSVLSQWLLKDKTSQTA